ncbi:MAG TPA: hypothetical protein EYP04_01450, partial [Anaerolineae bacterium]|nr:hypothetical protein [Anaerolineae bacterium]
MAKRRKKERAEPTRKQVAISRREQQQLRYITIGLAAVVILAVGVLAYGLLHEFVLKPASPIAKVGDVAIRTDAFQRRFNYQRFQLQGRLTQFYRIQQQLDPEGNNAFFQSQ